MASIISRKGLGRPTTPTRLARSGVVSGTIPSGWRNLGGELWQTKYSTMDQTIRAGDGNDTVVIDTNGGFWSVTNDVQGQAGDDIISAEAVAGDWEGVTNTTAVNNISGGLGDDIIQATAQGIYDAYWEVGANYVNGDAGNDRIDADSWQYNELYGGTGNDVILASIIEEIDLSCDTNNILDGGDGDDFLSATGRVVHLWVRLCQEEAGPHQPANRRHGQRHAPGLSLRRHRRSAARLRTFSWPATATTT